MSLSALSTKNTVPENALSAASSTTMLVTAKSWRDYLQEDKSSTAWSLKKTGRADREKRFKSESRPYDTESHQQGQI
jgi:hypothetical protein